MSLDMCGLRDRRARDLRRVRRLTAAMLLDMGGLQTAVRAICGAFANGDG